MALDVMDCSIAPGGSHSGGFFYPRLLIFESDLVSAIGGHHNILWFR